MDTHSGKAGKIPSANTQPPGGGSSEAAQPKTAAKLRFVARGSSPSEEDPMQLPRRYSTRAREYIGLNLSGSARKRHIHGAKDPLALAASPGATPSPTTQIAVRMHSIDLDKSPMVAAPSGLSTAVTIAAGPEEDEDLVVPQQASDEGGQTRERQAEGMDIEQARRSLPGERMPVSNIRARHLCLRKEKK